MSKTYNIFFRFPKNPFPKIKMQNVLVQKCIFIVRYWISTKITWRRFPDKKFHLNLCFMSVRGPVYFNNFAYIYHRSASRYIIHNVTNFLMVNIAFLLPSYMSAYVRRYIISFFCLLSMKICCLNGIRDLFIMIDDRQLIF